MIHRLQPYLAEVIVQTRWFHGHPGIRQQVHRCSRAAKADVSSFKCIVGSSYPCVKSNSAHVAFCSKRITAMYNCLDVFVAPAGGIRRVATRLLVSKILIGAADLLVLCQWQVLEFNLFLVACNPQGNTLVCNNNVYHTPKCAHIFILFGHCSLFPSKASAEYKQGNINNLGPVSVAECCGVLLWRTASPSRHTLACATPRGWSRCRC